MFLKFLYSYKAKIHKTGEKGERRREEGEERRRRHGGPHIIESAL